MKPKLIYFLPLLFVLATGCLKKASQAPAPIVPSGTFSGEFRYIHRPNDKVPFDTLKAEITVNLNTVNFTYKVTGDTSTVHAGSNGTFSLSSPYMIFKDKTAPTSGTPAKQHLNGAYLYYYDGSVFQMLAYNLDTLAVQYDLKKISN